MQADPTRASTFPRPFVMVLALLVIFAGLSAAPAHASTLGSFTINSSNCNSSGGCFGLDWTLTVNSGSFDGGLFNYEAILGVTDDPLVAGDPSVVISAVDFKVSDTVDSGMLAAFPTSSSGWSTGINVLNSGGCTGPGAGFICSQTASDPANFVASTSPQTWTWYFNTSDPIFANLDGAHIGAKMTDLSTSGRLLSASYAVPEPSSLYSLFMGAAAVFAMRRRRAA